MSTSKRPTTPIRRVSRGSISALASSHPSSGNPSATPLSHLETAMRDIADDVATLHLNLEQIQSIYEALGVFNENFSMYLYGLKMNAFCVEWPERPTEENFERANERQVVQRQQSAYQQSLYANPSIGVNLNTGRPSLGAFSDQGGAAGSLADQTYMTVEDSTAVDATPPRVAAGSSRGRGGISAAGTSRAGAGARTTTQQQPLKSALKKSSTTSTGVSAAGAGATAKKISPAVKRRREEYAHTIINTLPLEWRGSDQKLQKIAESVIVTLIDAKDKGMRLPEIVANTKLPQVQVNKCLNALALAKHVSKTQSGGVIYALDPNRHAGLP
ncbi:hypothetical protein K437DRAFT_255511 [Tilletiaria anomala UBC 951]|uniref:DASH complex subunit DAM1 n=1 Tax=Tilletiaria anomala (strain ATCC 24038 / CBS 436.72 / UBC 951) TaxID=1037660 RepID=A0A066WCM7_TILAU|nr:uncharacterized protein K437DRAFT_255511 [Tilletiaria anomala UBC 951]KDN48535.1 hypothetical protein K437DRAFT_255511 [Tilletiaria anomala UBC 951]